MGRTFLAAGAFITYEAAHRLQTGTTIKSVELGIAAMGISLGINLGVSLDREDQLDDATNKVHFRYAITEFGREVVALEAQRLAALADAARAENLIPGSRSWR